MSFLHHEYTETRAVNLPAILENLGLELTIGYDFELYRAIAETARPNHKVGLPFDPTRHHLGSGNACWIIGRDADGNVIHTQACRVIDLGDESMADYLEGHFTDFPPPVDGIDYARSGYRPGPSAQRMFGKVSYHGEFWISESDTRLRGSGLSARLAQFGYEQAGRHWDPDHFFAFILDPVACKGLAARAGWMHTQPKALHWMFEGQDIPVETFFCHLGRDDLHYLMSLQSAERQALRYAA